MFAGFIYKYKVDYGTKESLSSPTFQPRNRERPSRKTLKWIEGDTLATFIYEKSPFGEITKSDDSRNNVSYDVRLEVLKGKKYKAFLFKKTLEK